MKMKREREREREERREKREERGGGGRREEGEKEKERIEERRVERRFDFVEKCLITKNPPDESSHIPSDELFVRNFGIFPVFFRLFS